MPKHVRAVLERALRDGCVVATSDGSVHDLDPVAVPAAEGEALTAWVRREDARRTIEVGLGYAVATLFLCDALLENAPRACRHVAVDPHQETRFANCGVQLLEEAGVADVVELHAEESQIALPRFVSEGRRFDLAFVDGDHRFDRVFLDLVYLGLLVRPGGVVFLDDHQLPGVARAVSFFSTNLGWRLEETSTVDELHSWAVVRTSREPDTRAFDFFVDF